MKIHREKKTGNLHILCSFELKKDLIEEANEANLELSTFVRKILADYIKEVRQKRNAKK